MTYSSSLAMSRRRYAYRNQNAVSFAAVHKGFGPISNTIILIVLVCVLGLLYLTQVTKTSAYGYKINELHQQTASLKTEHDELEIASARLQALERARDSKVADGLVSVAPASVLQN